LEATRTIVSIQGTAIVLSFIVMAGGIFGIYHNRLKGKQSSLGARITQLTTVTLAVPAIIIVAALGVIKGETIAALLGSLLGYVLSGVGEYRPSSNTGDSDKKPSN